MPAATLTIELKLLFRIQQGWKGETPEVYLLLCFAEGLSHLRISLWDQNDFFFNEQIGCSKCSFNFQ